MTLYGRTTEGIADSITIYGFNPYFFAPSHEVRSLKDSLYTNQAVLKFDVDGYESLFGEPLGRIEVRKLWDLEEVASLFSRTYETDVWFTARARIDLGIYTGVEAPSRFCHYEEIDPVDMKVEPRVVTFDIETDDRGDFPEMGEKAILSIVAHDNYTDEYHGFIDLAGRSVTDVFPNGKPEGLTALHFDPDERSMLERFADWIQEIDPDLWTGWNIESFDMPYLVARMVRLDIPPYRLSRNGTERKNNVRLKGRHVRIKGQTIYDMLPAYKSTKRGELRSYSLNAVAEEELGEQKIDHTGESIYEMWCNDADKLMRYNAIDVQLVVEIERECGVLAFKGALRDEVGVDFEGTVNNYQFIEMMTRRKLYEKGVVAPDAEFVEKEEKYEGAYVFPPYTGVAENVVGMDLASLYPYTMAMLNASPETKLPSGNFDGPHSRPPTGARFRLDVDGIFKELVDDAIALKAEYKKLRNQYEAGTPEYEEYSERYDVSKTITNSIYGITGWERFFLYDEAVAESTTLMGQQVIKATQRYINDETVGEVIYGDTDSNYVRFPAHWSKERCLEEAQKIAEALNTEVYPALAEEYGIPPEDNLWEIEVEAYMERFFQAGKKKRYAYLCTWKDGKDCDPKVSITGFTRSDIALLTKELQDTILKKILEGATEAEIGQTIYEAAKEIKPTGSDLERVGIPGGLSKPLEEYAWTNGTPKDAHPRAAWFANELYGENFGSGSKPKRVYVKPYTVDGFEHEIDVLAFDDPSTVPQTVTLDTTKMNDSLIVKPLRTILDAVDVNVDAALKNQLQTGLAAFM
ncbi:DNA polymerase domain-containing protein [Halovalidus salilacus]|uniref:DNA polymerase domain-containing protein n=1 Tax=Halovalidus salilacus TaxID=3075124 RepID=UPI00360C0C27